jgi:glutamine---fructose-6-phosphate transaminase (isomerizing)
MSHLENEIREQPAAIERLLHVEQQSVANLARAIRARDIRYVVIAARGSSDNAATYGQYLLGALCRLPVALATPSLFGIYRTPPRLDGALVLGISQSGQSPDIVSVLEEGRAQGVLTAAITNEPASPLARAADHVIELHAGAERSIAATKTYTTQLGAVAMLGAELCQEPARQAELTSLPLLMEQTIAAAGPIAGVAPRYRYMDTCAVIGRGYNYATAFEIALKLKELTYVIAGPYSSADFMHGPLAIVEHGFPVLVVAPDGAVYPELYEFMQQLRRREAELLVISDREEALDIATTPLRLPAPAPEWLSPFTAVIPGQILALHLTLARGYDPDHPRGLRKVTETR